MTASNQYILVFCSLLILCATAQLPTTGPGTSGDGIDHCQKCGNDTDTGLPAATISRCTVEKRNTVNIRNSTFLCECRGHFTGNGLTCDDFDECMDKTDNCDTNAHCINTPGSWNCSCKAGWSGDGVDCENIDECALAGVNANDTYCDSVGKCLDTNGGWTCICDDGYTLNANETNCIDENECMNKNGGCEDQCINTVGSFFCTCYPGYEEKDPASPGKGCMPINECERLLSPCGDNANCVDTDESFYCDCKTGFKWEDGLRRHCVDINECENNNYNCSGYPDTECHNLYGSHDCVCKEGWRGVKGSCENINECAEATSKCDKNARCDDKNGNYTCTCKSGYTGDGNNCKNINECASASANDCDKNAKCEDKVGSFDCTCIYGYEGNGTLCVEAKYDGRDISGEAGRLSRSKIFFQMHVLDHERMQLELEHEKALRRCATQVQHKRLEQQRGRREVIDVNVKNAQSAEAMVSILRKRNADLALENHALRISCPE